MKANSLFLLIALSLGTFSCADDDDNLTPVDIVGEWRLSAVLADPGDGSGEFEPVVSTKEISFSNQNTFTSNYSLCGLNSDDIAGSGIYSLVAKTITPDDCVTLGGSPFGLELIGDELIISYLCIEPCQEKYLRE